jgi:hypothetical protein
METILFVILAFALLYVVIRIILEQSKSKRRKALRNQGSKMSQSKLAQPQSPQKERASTIADPIKSDPPLVVEPENPPNSVDYDHKVQSSVIPPMGLNRSHPSQKQG